MPQSGLWRKMARVSDGSEAAAEIRDGFARHTLHVTRRRATGGNASATLRLGGVRRRSRHCRTPNQNTDLSRRVGEVGRDARAREDDDPDRQDGQQRIVAFERRCLGVAGPVGLVYAICGTLRLLAEQAPIAGYLASERRIAFNEQGIFRHYKELDA
jgi:hypothetical protein